MMTFVSVCTFISVFACVAPGDIKKTVGEELFRPFAEVKDSRFKTLCQREIVFYLL